MIIGYFLQLSVIQAMIAGFGKSDVTGAKTLTLGPIGEIDLMGYAKLGQEANGIHFRLFARSFILGDKDNRIAYVNLDAGQVSHFVKSRAVKLLNDRLKSPVYSIENVMIACTHTHAGPAGTIHSLRLFGSFLVSSQYIWCCGW
jgi:hypothetical protein